MKPLSIISKLLWVLGLSNWTPEQPNSHDIFYIKKDQKACWIAGYTVDGNTTNSQQMIESLMRNQRQAAALFKVNLPDVHTMVVTESRRYKSCRVFWTTTPVVPEGAYVVNNPDWTMHSWLAD